MRGIPRTLAATPVVRGIPPTQTFDQSRDWRYLKGTSGISLTWTGAVPGLPFSELGVQLSAHPIFFYPMPALHGRFLARTYL